MPASLAVGLGKACDIAQRDMVSDTAHIRDMADRLYQGITSQCDGVVLNGPQSTDQRYVGNMNLSFSYVEGESLIMGLKVLASGALLLSAGCCGDSITFEHITAVGGSCSTLLLLYLHPRKCRAFWPKKLTHQFGFFCKLYVSAAWREMQCFLG